MRMEPKGQTVHAILTVKLSGKRNSVAEPLNVGNSIHNVSGSIVWKRSILPGFPLTEGEFQARLIPVY